MTESNSPNADLRALVTCAVVGCDRPRLAKGMCRVHRRRVLATGEPGDPIITARTPRGVHIVCSVPGCGRPHACFGLCHAHRQRQRVSGQVGGPIRESGYPTLCSAYGCHLVAHARGLCRRHYDQSRKA